MRSLGRILLVVLVVVSIGVAVARHPPDWLDRRVEAARAAQDPWQAYVAPESTCPGREDTKAVEVAQSRTVVCLLDYARARRGLPALATIFELNESALLKAVDIAGCADFSHTACDKSLETSFARAGYRGATDTAEGENIAWGAGDAGSPLAIVSGWLNSPSHRENLFSLEWREQGIAVVKRQTFLGGRQAEIWVSHFGTRT